MKFDSKPVHGDISSGTALIDIFFLVKWSDPEELNGF
jgi:hypothetical protein